MKIINKGRLINWYRANLGKVVLYVVLSFIIPLSITYIPYLNIGISSPMIKLFIVVLFWFIIFSPKTKILVTLAMISIFFAFVLNSVRFYTIAEPFGDMMYLLLIFIFINYVKEAFEERRQL